MKTYHGELEAYWEQGWEGAILFSFMPKGGRGLHDLIALQNGQHLTIFDPDGSELWSGTIEFVRRNERLDRHNLKADIWSYEKQKGVSYADWVAWFWHEPPLKAKLEMEEENPESQTEKDTSMSKPTNTSDHPNINKNVHPPIVAMIFIAIGLALGKLVPALAGMNETLKNVGLGMTFIGFLFGVGAYIEFRKAHTTLNPHGSVRALVTSGIYRFTRNPIYLGFVFMVAGFPLAYGTLWGVVAAPFFMATISRLVIEKEEAYLEKKFKEGYTSYKSRVRRWL
ncbi:MAG: isoprenylcysteine carboxylmethyltransferase family protein [Chloroflexi bacterium]|nr:isoprenylcysteine carboxylmethyltransferase family protein [Chloroflexota bacterium]